MPLRLADLTSPDGLPATYPHMVEGMNIVDFRLLDLAGTVVWSTEPEEIDMSSVDSPMFQEAATGGIASTLNTGHGDHEQAANLREHTQILKTFLPLRETQSGPIIGVMEVDKDVADDVALQVHDAKSTVLWATTGTLGGLYVVLLGFIAVADVTIYRARRREMLAVEGSKRTLEERVQQRTRELEASNSQLVNAQDQLLRSERLATIGQLAGGVAHDLRNPLGAIKNSVYNLKKRLADSEVVQSNPKIGQFLKIMEEEIDHSNQIITDLMMFTHCESASHTDF
ncbi:MAG: histidine kinase dimerization/phospho-acceptor domain-containing protein [Dehalococcoidia bacterium]